MAMLQGLKMWFTIAIYVAIVLGVIMILVKVLAFMVERFKKQ